ncbi:hypothetical protein [Streptacidiphilus cavernicola]|uniref:HNH endonuclease n=1 Tax=Streptacidiphilus cavernicola TaxID=3342716 RepID=A0ABV6VUV0_9ACTN
MIPLQRQPLPPDLAHRLRLRGERLHRTDLSTAAVRREWSGARTVRQGLRRSLLRMTGESARCMYCCDSMGTDIDHFQPIALAPLRAFDWLNHFLACSYCNSNQKRELYPCDEVSGECLLIDPSRDDPADHLRLLFSSGLYRGRTPKGRQTIAVFGLNDRPELVRGRGDAYLLCRDTLAGAGRRTARGGGVGGADSAARAGRGDGPDQVELLLRALSRRPNGDVLHAMLAVRHLPDAPRMFGADAVLGLHRLAAVLAAPS